jgi:transcriptional regulator with XRE-family HTH domain
MDFDLGQPLHGGAGKISRVQPDSKGGSTMFPHPRACADLDKFVGQKIRGFRHKHRISQSGLGKALGISFQQIQNYERGFSRCSAARLQQMADAFGCTVTDLLPPLKANGKKRSSVVSNLDKLAATSDGMKLINYFVAIEDPEHRAAVVDMARRLVPH